MDAGAVSFMSTYSDISSFVDDVGCWEFETLRSQNAPQSNERSQNILPPIETQDYDTIRALGSTSALPTSLRHLFDDKYSSQAESFCSQSLSMNLLQPSMAPTTTLLQDKTLKFSGYQDGPRLYNQNTKDIPASTPDTVTKQSRQANVELLNSASLSNTLDVTNSLPTASIEIPNLDGLSASTSPLFVSPNKHTDEASNSPSSPMKLRPQRQRSRSNTEAPECCLHDRDLASPAAFRFPLDPKAKNKIQVTDAFVPVLKPMNVGSPISHQAAHSLDTTSRQAVIQSLVLPSMYRARSATAVQQVHSRDGSKPPDMTNETIFEPSKLPIRNLAERTGSEASLGTPGLKDVLKVS